ncbi:hypothetical protein NMY22_g3702 [Coprinellus aureogranulatus]|nr:hypothetical protein NMY22_g3702 [Coprinellus aureogranulatus]
MATLAIRPAGLLWPDFVKTPHPRSDLIRRTYLSKTLARTLDRTAVLGNGDDYGHSGCVNAVSWAEDGNLLLTAGDDTTVRLWRMDPASDSESDYPFVCRSVIQTGHRANIFNCHMLPFSNRIVTCAGDKQIRVFDATTALEVRDGLETEFSARSCSGRVIRCHNHRVKKIVTEESPDCFLSLSEDGTVRQHDLRMRHSCREDACPAPLVEMRDSDGDLVELSNMSLSRMTPYQFVVVGESPCGYLFDRRSLKRVMEYEWGMINRAGEGVTTCVRRFGRPPPPATNERSRRPDHISGCRMSETNGHEVVLSYLKDKIYLFSTLDDPVLNDDMSKTQKPVLPSNAKAVLSKGQKNRTQNTDDSMPAEGNQGSGEEEPDFVDGESEGLADEDGEDEEDLDFLFNQSHTESEWLYDGVSVVHPRMSYSGHRSRDTIKDVNFLGPFDEYVVSGSDDGNWFVWQRDTGKLHGIYEGDESVVNVVEGHPHLPLVALFSTAPGGGSIFSKMHKQQEILDANSRYKPVLRIPLTSLLLHQIMRGGSANENEGQGEDSGPQCPTQ